MGGCSVDGPQGPTIKSVEEMAGRFYAEMLTLVPVWKQRLADAPDQLEPLETEVQTAFARGADLLVAGLIAVVMKQAEFDAACEQTRGKFQQPLARGRKRTIRVRLLSGLVMWVASLYCAPLRKSEGQVSGLYVELAQFGFGKGVTPGLQSRVARQAALCPSLDLARQELLRAGVKVPVHSTTALRAAGGACA